MADILYDDTVDDDVWRVTVERLNDSIGILKVIKTVTATIVHQQEVTLMFGAIFGPDIDDVNHWQDLAIGIIDDPSKRKEPT